MNPAMHWGQRSCRHAWAFGATPNLTRSHFPGPTPQPTNDDIQRHYKGIKGHCLNNILAFLVDGTICDYVLGGFGCSHDSAVASPLFDRLNDPAVNTGKVGALVDPAFIKFCNNGVNGQPKVMRPTKAGDKAKNVGFAKKVSAWIVRARQFNEHGNGQLKRSFPLFARKTSVTNARELALQLEDMEMCIRLYNHARASSASTKSSPLLCRTLTKTLQSSSPASTTSRHTWLHAKWHGATPSPARMRRARWQCLTLSNIRSGAPFASSCPAQQRFYESLSSAAAVAAAAAFAAFCIRSACFLSQAARSAGMRDAHVMR